MSVTRQYAEDVFDLPVEEPAAWGQAVQQGNASVFHNAHKVAHLLLFGVRADQGRDLTYPIPLTPERTDGLAAISRVRPEIGHALLTELYHHPDRTAGQAAVVSVLEADPGRWGRITAMLARGSDEGQLAAWLDQRPWDLASQDDLQAVVSALARQNRPDLLAGLRSRWALEQAIVDALLHVALPTTGPFDHLAVLDEVLTAQPSDMALTLAWLCLSKVERFDHPQWDHLARRLPSPALAPVVTQLIVDRGGCWLSHQGNPRDINTLADRLGRYATPEDQHRLLEAFPGQLPALQAAQRHERLVVHPGGVGRLRPRS